jgi:hypothetical protein
VPLRIGRRRRKSGGVFEIPSGGGIIGFGEEEVRRATSIEAVDEGVARSSLVKIPRGFRESPLSTECRRRALQWPRGEVLEANSRAQAEGLDDVLDVGATLAMNTMTKDGCPRIRSRSGDPGVSRHARFA